MSDPGGWLLVMRHGEAEPRATTDMERRLTEEGRAQVIVSVQAAVQRGVTPDLIIASPLARAQETARIARDQLGSSAPIETWNELVPDGQCEAVIRRFEQVPGIPLLVSHQPLVGRLVEYLCDDPVSMPTAALAGIRYDCLARGCGRLEWMWQP